MADPLHTIAGTLREAFAQATGLPADTIDPVVRPSDRADAQANGALALGKRLGRNPREVAEAAVATGLLGRRVQHTSRSPGPASSTSRSQPEFLAAQLAAAAADAHLGVRDAVVAEVAVVDYSAPNVAKEMHVGHLRTTVIGDALVRMLEFVGHTVIRENHVGDWGTPFGMLIEHLVDLGGADAELRHRSSATRRSFYRQARAKFDASDEFKERARGPGHAAAEPQRRTDDGAVAASSSTSRADYFNVVYGKLGVLLTDDDLVGESFYQPQMPTVLERLDAAGLLQESDGAKVVFVPGFTNREGEPLPLIVQQRDGGFNYATSDLACVIDRIERLHGTTARLRRRHAAEPAPADGVEGRGDGRLAASRRPRAVHVNFGNVLGDDRKMFKSRSGEPAMLLDLVDEAIERGDRAGGRAQPRPARRRSRASSGGMIGIGALKYADLSHRPHQGLRLRLGSHARLRRQHGAVPAVRARPHLQHLPPRRHRSCRPCAASSRPSASRRNVRSHCTCCSSTPRCTTRSSGSARTGCAPTCSSWRRRSPRSTRPARCSRTATKPTRASRLALCDLTARVLRAGPGAARHRRTGAHVT